jgi:hypothetical protein
MKKIMLIISLIVIGIGYSGVLNYYGKIVGTINVQGPIFYADFSQRKLLSNTKPSSLGTLELNDSEFRRVISEPIDTIFNYKIKCEFSVKAKSNMENQTLRVYCKYHDGNEWKELCYSNINVSTTLQTYTTSCIAKIDPPYSVKIFSYDFEGQSLDSSVIYTIESNPNGDTRLQLDKAT